jgi:hypothetical protein
VPDPNKGLAERVEVFTRSASDALQKAVGDVLDARNPWQLLYRLSRIVLLGLVLYTAWLLITLQPDLARRLSRPPDHSLTERVVQHKAQIQTLLRTSLEGNDEGLHTLVLLQWSGGSSATVLAAAGRDGQLGLTPGQEPLLGVEMADALGHLALGLCASEQPEALPIRSASASATGAALLCPVGCGSSPQNRPLLLSLYDEPPGVGASSQPRQLRRQQELLLIAQRLGELLADDGPGGAPGAGHGKSQ